MRDLLNYSCKAAHTVHHVHVHWFWTSCPWLNSNLYHVVLSLFRRIWRLALHIGGPPIEYRQWGKPWVILKTTHWPSDALQNNTFSSFSLSDMLLSASSFSSPKIWVTTSSDIRRAADRSLDVTLFSMNIRRRSVTSLKAASRIVTVRL